MTITVNRLSGYWTISAHLNYEQWSTTGQTDVKIMVMPLWSVNIILDVGLMVWVCVECRGGGVFIM